MSQEYKKQKTMSSDNFANVGDQVQITTDENPVREIESLCMNCHEQGTTRLLLTRIPFFREVILMSFECPHCHFKNSEIQPAAQISEKGARYVLKVEEKADFNRQVVKSETATVKFVELDIEVPPKRGQLTNIEGLLNEIIDDLEGDQPARLQVQPEIHAKIAEVIANMRSFIDDESKLPLTVVVDDPAGNSWIEYKPGEAAHKWSSYEYARTAEQNVFLGLISADEVAQQRTKKAAAAKSAAANSQSNDHNPKVTGFVSDASEIENLNAEVQTFSATCSSCFKPCETHMKTVDIPHFKEVIIMSTVCDHCGYKSNEVKTGGAIPDKGRKITLKVTDPEDLARDILKSETCGMEIPELNLDLTPGTLGGRFTTIEGLLTQVTEELHSRVFTQTSDSMDEETKGRWTIFFARLQDAIEGKIPFSIKMVDPMASSYIQNVYAPDADPEMTVEDYERTFEENEELGLNDMKVDEQK